MRGSNATALPGKRARTAMSRMAGNKVASAKARFFDRVLRTVLTSTAYLLLFESVDR
jgi:hypothetical protein